MTHFSFPLPDETATARLGAALAGLARPGDVFLLEGDLGAGKTTLARGFIQSLCGPEEEAPSPTFTLVQTYDAETGEIWHFDLYRLEKSNDVLELGWDEALDAGILLVEWPDRLGPLRPADAVEVGLSHEGKGRRATVNGTGPLAERVKTLEL